MRTAGTISALLALAAAAGGQTAVAELQTPGLFPGDVFGDAVAIEGDRALIGNPHFDDLGPESGSAHVFERQAGGPWHETAELVPSDAKADLSFGTVLGLSGDSAAVGSFDTNYSTNGPGAVYVFERQPDGSWPEVQKLVAPDGHKADFFGRAVAIDGDRILVGSTHVDTVFGAAYLFERQPGGAWTFVTKLTATPASKTDFFGASVSLSGDTAFVGAPQGSISALSAGAAFVFERQAGGGWIQVQRLEPSDGGIVTTFAGAMTVRGDRAVLGASNADQKGQNSGAAYVYERAPAGGWIERQILHPAEAAEFDGFGVSVAIDGPHVLVGATGVDGAFPSSGAAFLFTYEGGGLWSETAKLFSPNITPTAGVAWSVALSGGRALVGSPDFFGSGGSATLFELPLAADVAELSLATGGSQVLAVRAGPQPAANAWLLLGSASGTSPGILLDAHRLPLNVDAYALFTLGLGGAPPLAGGAGTLLPDGTPAGPVSIDLPPGALSPALAGTVLHHAWLVLDLSEVHPFAGATSPAVPLELVP